MQLLETFVVCLSLGDVGEPTAGFSPEEDFSWGSHLVPPPDVVEADDIGLQVILKKVPHLDDSVHW